MNAHEIDSIERLIRLPEVMLTTGLGRSQIYAKMSSGEFPASVPISAKSRGWVRSEVRGWIGERIAERDGARVEAGPAVRRA
ncbi:MAG: helix-turn-helix transcriptional regulator [Metallibacterium scheffleri]|jgi:prophage regulatory protein